MRPRVCGVGTWSDRHSVRTGAKLSVDPEGILSLLSPELMRGNNSIGRGGGLIIAIAFLLIAALIPATASAASYFSPTGSMGTPRYAPGASPLPDGRVLVAGGIVALNTYGDSAEIFDPATSTRPSGKGEAPGA